MSETVAFIGSRRLAKGPLSDVAVAAMHALSAGETQPILLFDAVTSQPIDIDFRGSANDVRARLETAHADDAARGRGRPKLGVTAREVTLLPRHWDWLARERGGASAALRRLVDEARRGSAAADSLRHGKESLYRFATAMAGDAPGYEEATRALFAGDGARFAELTAAWPDDVRAHALTLTAAAFGQPPSPLDALLSPAERTSAERVLRAAFPGDAVTAAERMTYGASGAGVFKLTIADCCYVLRLEGRPDGFRDPVRQHACLVIAASAGVAPRLIHADIDAGAAITDFIADVSAEPPLDRKGRIIALVGAVKRLHAAPLFPRLMGYFEGMDALFAQFTARDLFTAGALDELQALYAQLAASYPQDGDLVSSHNDLNPSNVIFQGARPWIIDWESAFAADRFVDLAAIANFFAADADEAILTLQTYFDGAANDSDQARLLLMQQVNRLFYGMMLLSVAAGERPGLKLDATVLEGPRFTEIRGEMASLATTDGRLRFGGAFLAEALHQMRGPDVQAAMKIVRAA